MAPLLGELPGIITIISGGLSPASCPGTGAINIGVPSSGLSPPFPAFGLPSPKLNCGPCCPACPS